MRFQVITLFPEMILQACSHGVIGQAWSETRLRIEAINPRQFTEDVHHSVDDRPFGGGDGMVMSPDPLASAIDLARARALEPSMVRVVYLSARGRPFTDSVAREYALLPELVLICGRYGGVDQRLIETRVDEELAVGDYVLSGGELAALVVVDAVGRLQPGVLGNSVSAEAESFANGLLEAPQFTRPREWRGLSVPEALVSGHHARIDVWRQALSILTTAERRPDLLQRRGVTAAEAKLALDCLHRMAEPERRACGLKSLERIHSLIQNVVRDVIQERT